MKPMCQNIFYKQLPTCDTIHKWTLAPEVGLFPDNGVDTKCPSMEPMCQIISYNQLPTYDSIIHKWTLAPEGSSSISVLSPMYNPNTGADTKCLAMEPMCQIMFNNQLPTSDTNIHKWTLSPDGSYSTLVSLSMWNADTGADTK